ncbi:MAG: MMPL family transporter [Pseudomonadota bacterium]
MPNIEIKNKPALFGFFAWLMVVLIGLSFIIYRFSNGISPIETNMLSMLPVDQRNAASEVAVSRLVELSGQRIVMLVGNKDVIKARQAAEAAFNVLKAGNGLEQVQGEVGKVNLDKLLASYKQYRFSLLAPQDRVSLQENPSEWLEQQLAMRLMLPVQGSIGLDIQEDPFGFFNRFLMTLPFNSQKLHVDNGWLTTEGEGAQWIMLSAKIKGNPYSSHVQNDVMKSLNSAIQTAQNKGSYVKSTGAVFFANYARTQAESEMHLIGAISIIGVLLVMMSVFRSLRYLVLGLAAILAGMIVATAVTLLVFKQLNLLTLVMGASLIGIAIDYPIQLFAYQIELGDQWNLTTGLRRVKGALILGLLAAVIGFGSLYLLPFPGLEQIAVFACIGLTGALLTVFGCYPLFLNAPAHYKAKKSLYIPGTILRFYDHLCSGKKAFLVLLLGLLITFPGIMRLHTDDDVHRFMVTSPKLLNDEASIQTLIGQGNSRQFFLIEGYTEEELLSRSQVLLQRLEVLKEQGELKNYQAIASFIPPQSQQLKDAQLLQHVFKTDNRLEKTLKEAGFKDHLIKSYLESFASASGRYFSIEAWLAMPLSAPFRHLWLGPIDHKLATVIIPTGFKSFAALEKSVQGLEGVSWVDKAGSVSRLFQQFRESSTRLFAIALVITFMVLVWRYTWSTATLMMLLMVAVLWMTLGVLGFLNIAINLFVALAFRLVLGLGIDYTIFLQEAREKMKGQECGHDRAAFLGVILSAAMNILSFGLLAFSSTPAVSDFGFTLLIGVTFALLTAPFLSLMQSSILKKSHSIKAFQS